MLSRTEGSATRTAVLVLENLETRMSARRPWTYAAAGAVVATAVIVAAVAVAGDRIGLAGSDERGSGSVGASPSVAESADPSGKGAPTGPATGSASTPGSPGSSASGSAGGGPSGAPSSSAPGPGQLVVPAYYLGDAAAGTRLFREFHRVDAAVRSRAGCARCRPARSTPTTARRGAPGPSARRLVRRGGRGRRGRHRAGLRPHAPPGRAERGRRADGGAAGRLHDAGRRAGPGRRRLLPRGSPGDHGVRRADPARAAQRARRSTCSR